MLSKAYKRRQKVSATGFRYRGIVTSRLENLTDAVFGFSITLLVIASEVPTNYVELEASMYGFSGFIFCILLLLGIWNNHNNFFLYYGMQDRLTKTLTFLFLFLLLFYIYPLKYLFSYLGTALYARVKMAMGDQSEALQLALSKLNESNLSTPEWENIMIRFGLGLFFIYLLFGLDARARIAEKRIPRPEQSRGLRNQNLHSELSDSRDDHHPFHEHCFDFRRNGLSILGFSICARSTGIGIE